MSTPIDRTFGEALARARARRGWSQSQLGDMLGVDQHTVNQLEHGQLEHGQLEHGQLEEGQAGPGTDTIKAAAELFNLATPAQVERAEETAWNMALEGRKLTPDGYERLVEAIVDADSSAKNAL